MAFNLSMSASDIDKTLVESRQLLDGNPATKQYVDARTPFITPQMFGAKGDGVTDDTAAWAAAIATGERIVCEQGKTYLVTSAGITENDNAGNAQFLLSSGQSIDFNGSAILWKHPTGNYKGLFVVSRVSNVELCNGVIIGDRDTNATEYLHPVIVMSSTNVRIKSMTIKESGGDGIILNEYGSSGVPCKNIEIVNCHIYHAYRNAVSIIMADGVEIHGCKFENTVGTSPQAGIDVEPNRTYEYAKNINIHHCSFINNGARGLLVGYHNNPAAIEVTANHCYFEGNGRAVHTSSGAEGEGLDTVGYISVSNCTAKSSGTNAILIAGGASGNVAVEIDKVTVIDANTTGNTHVATGAAVQVIGVSSDSKAQNIRLNDIRISGTTHMTDLYAKYAIFEYKGELPLYGVYLTSLNTNARVIQTNAPKVMTAKTYSLDVAKRIFQKYLKPATDTADTKVTIGDLPSNLDVEFINCSAYKINIVSGEDTYVVSPGAIGTWVGAYQKVIGEKPVYTKSEVGLGKVDNVKQYSASNPPPYPVTSVNGKTGAVTVPTKTSELTNDSGFLTQHQSLADYAKKTDIPTVPTNLSGFTNDIYNTVAVVATYEDGTTETLNFMVKK